jgi:hypothetical protein
MGPITDPPRAGKLCEKASGPRWLRGTQASFPRWVRSTFHGRGDGEGGGVGRQGALGFWYATISSPRRARRAAYRERLSRGAGDRATGQCAWMRACDGYTGGSPGVETIVG